MLLILTGFTMTIHFFDCLGSTSSNLVDFAEEYLYLDGISSRHGFNRYIVLSTKEDILLLDHSHCPQKACQQVAFTVIKIFSYILCPLLAVFALIVKATYRLNILDYTFSTSRSLDHDNPRRTQERLSQLPSLTATTSAPLITPLDACATEKMLVPDEPAVMEDVFNLPEIIPQKYDIRGAKWLNNRHLFEYWRHLSKTHPQLVISTFHTTTKTMLPQIERDFLKLKKENFLAYTSPTTAATTAIKTILAYPVHVMGNHWTLLYIDIKNRTISYFDSKKTYGNYEKIMATITALASKLSHLEPSKDPFVVKAKITTSLQPDGYQCGPWTLFFLENLLKNPNVDFNSLNVDAAQAMIAKYRLDVMHVLIQNHLNNTCKTSRCPRIASLCPSIPSRVIT